MGRNELARIQFGPEPGQPLGGMGSVRFWVLCNGNSGEVLAKAREALAVVVSKSADNWPSDEEWEQALPPWFIKKCRPPYSEQELKEELRLPYEEKLRRVRERTELWPMGAWIYWFRPENRYWFWWDAVAVNPDRIVVAVEVTDWPFPWGSLDWLFRAAGAVRVDPEP